MDYIPNPDNSRADAGQRKAGNLQKPFYAASLSPFRMAKKWKKKIEEERYDFKYPKFDEKEYMQKEQKETRVILFTTLYAVIFAFLSLAMMVYATKDCMLGLAVGLIGMASLRYFYPAVKIDISAFDAKKWLMNSLTFLGFWLVIWILLCNPPFSDFTPPSIDTVKTSLTPDKVIKNGETFAIFIGNTSSTAISISARITDNSKLNPASVTFTITASGQGSPGVNSTERVDSTWIWGIKSISSGVQYDVSISAKDTNNNPKTFTCKLDVKS
jgi:hypothetical protein